MSRLSSRSRFSPHIKQLPLSLASRRRQLLHARKALDRTYERGCLLALLPDYLRKAITDWATEHIPDCHLSQGGRVLRPHLTLKYGFVHEEGVALGEFLRGRPPLQTQLTGLGLFPEGPDGVPLYATVDSPDAVKLNSQISEAFECEDTHPVYKPHVTIAYLRPEVAESYLKETPSFIPCAVALDELEWSAPDGSTVPLKLSLLPRLGLKSLGDEDMNTRVKPSPFVGRKSLFAQPTYLIKSQGEPCKQGETAARSGCIPASGEGGKTPGKTPDRPAERESGASEGGSRRERPETRVTRSTDDRFNGEFKVGGKEYDYSAGGYEGRWQISFRKHVGGVPTTRAGGGTARDALQVMQAVGDLTEKFIKDKNPREFYFTASAKEPSRVKLYDRMADRMADSMGYTLERSEDKTKVTYNFTKSTWKSLTSSFDPRSLRDKLRMTKAVKSRLETVKDAIREGGQKAVDTAGKAAIATRGFFRNLSERVLGKAGTEAAEAALNATHDAVNTIIMGDDALPEDLGGMASNVAINLIPDLVAWGWRLARKAITGVDPRDVPVNREKSLPDGVDLEAVADMLVELQQQYREAGMDFEPMDKDGCLELLERGLEEEPGSRGEKSLSYFVKMEERRDTAGRRYCVEEGRGIVPCGEQKTTEQGDTPGVKPSPAPATGAAPRKLGGESSPTYKQETQRHQRREQRKQQRIQEREQKRQQQQAVKEALDAVPIKEVVSGVQEAKKEAKSIYARTADKVKGAQLAAKAGALKMVDWAAKKFNLDEDDIKRIKDKIEGYNKDETENYGKKAELPSPGSWGSIHRVLKSVAPELAGQIYRRVRKAITKKDPREEPPSSHAREYARTSGASDKARQAIRAAFGDRGVGGPNPEQTERLQRKLEEEWQKIQNEQGGQKALSWLANDRGGALVPPPAQGKKIPLKRGLAGRKLLMPKSRVKSRSDAQAERFAELLGGLSDKAWNDRVSYQGVPEARNDPDVRQLQRAYDHLLSQLAATKTEFGEGSTEAGVVEGRLRNLEEQLSQALEWATVRAGKSLGDVEVKAGFTGERPDKLGRRMCYRDGKRVPCPKKGEQQTKPTRESVDTGGTPVKEETPVSDENTPPTADEYQDWSEGQSRSDMDQVFEIVERYHNGLSLEQAIAEMVNKVPGTEPRMARERLLWADADRYDRPIDREPTPEEVRKVHNPETGRQSAIDAVESTPGARQRIKEGQPITDVDLEELSEEVHDAWMRREASLPGGGRASRRHLMVPYDQLSEEDKEKDRDFVREVIASMRPKDYWGSKEQPFYRPGSNPTVDSVVTRQGEGGPEVLLIRRKEGTAEGGKWALPGGFINTTSDKGEAFRQDEEIPKWAALRELVEETGLIDLTPDQINLTRGILEGAMINGESINERLANDIVKKTGLPSSQVHRLVRLASKINEVGTFDTRGRDPRDNAEAWAVSDAFSIDLPPELADAYVQGRDDADRAEWVPVSELGNYDIAFDHRDIIDRALPDDLPTREEQVELAPEEPGFTGTDAQGREWRDGELVAKQDTDNSGVENTQYDELNSNLRRANSDNASRPPITDEQSAARMYAQLDNDSLGASRKKKDALKIQMQWIKDAFPDVVQKSKEFLDREAEFLPGMPAKESRPKPLTVEQLVKRAADGRYGSGYLNMAKKTGWLTDGRIMFKLPPKEKTKVDGVPSVDPEARFPRYEDIINGVKGNSSKVEVVGNRNSEFHDHLGPLYAIRNAAGKMGAVSAKLWESVLKRYPDAVPYVSPHKNMGDAPPVAFKTPDGEVVAVVMPMTVDRLGSVRLREGEGSPSVESEAPKPKVKPSPFKGRKKPR